MHVDFLLSEMNFIRPLFKSSATVGCTLFFYSLMIFPAIGSLFGVNFIRGRGFLLEKWARVCCRILGVSVNVKGEGPKPPFFLVCNHLSYLDIFILFAHTRGVFVANMGVRAWPVIGFMAKTCGIIFIDRSRKRDVRRVNNLIAQNITEDQGVIVFPESTTGSGVDILPFRSSLLEYPAIHRLPVHFAAISYSSPKGKEVAAKRICWWEDVSFFEHFWNFLKLKKTGATLTFGNEPKTYSDRKKLADTLRKDVKLEFIPVIDRKSFNKLMSV